MKLSDFKKALVIRWKILKSSMLFSFKESLVYTLDNYGNFLSMIIYMITYLVFIDVLFGRVKLVAGYNIGQMLLFTLIIQINYYLTSIFSLQSIDQLDTSINTGELDLWLAKPVPALWYVTFRKINLGELLFNAFPATIPLLIMLSGYWSSLRFSLPGVFAGTLSLFMGQIIIHCYQFIIGLTAFFTGEGKNARNLSTELSMFGDMVPFEGYPQFIKALGLTIVPCLIHSALSVSLMLGKTTNYLILLYVLGLMILFLLAKSYLWKFALRHYSSASS